MGIENPVEVTSLPGSASEKILQAISIAKFLICLEEPGDNHNSSSEQNLNFIENLN